MLRQHSVCMMCTLRFGAGCVFAIGVDIPLQCCRLIGDDNGRHIPRESEKGGRLREDRESIRCACKEGAELHVELG